LLIAFLYVGAVLCGPLTLALLCAFLCWQGAHEYGMLTHLGQWYMLLALSGVLTLLAVLLFGSVALFVAPVAAFFCWSLLTILVVERGLSVEKAFLLAIAGFWGYLYVGWLPAHLLALINGKFPGLVLGIGLGVALSDVGAFCLGKWLSGPKLAPRLSPSKTWSGVLGNVCGASVAMVLMRPLLPGLAWWQYSLFAVAIGLGSVWGDLLESLLKRTCGVKDAGTLLPGFGGLLDRIDSLLLVAPLVYYLSRLILR
jgi:phosphatidate cytidylyltransferase